MITYGWDKRPPSKPEMGSGKPSRIEIAGYVSVNDRIAQIMLAGERLVQTRREQYDVEGEDLDDVEIDPTRRPGYDLADATEASQRIASRKRAAATTVAPATPSEPPGDEVTDKV